MLRGLFAFFFVVAVFFLLSLSRSGGAPASKILRARLFGEPLFSFSRAKTLFTFLNLLQHTHTQKRQQAIIIIFQARSQERYKCEPPAIPKRVPNVLFTLGIR